MAGQAPEHDIPTDARLPRLALDRAVSTGLALDRAGAIAQIPLSTLCDFQREALVSKPSVLFVCVHNAGRSQMAAAYLTHLAAGRIEVLSAGSAPAQAVNSAVVEALAEEGIDISAEIPKFLTDQAVRSADVVITMGCGDACPVYPGKRYEDWALADPAGQGVDAVRPIRDEIRSRVTALLNELVGSAN